MSFRLQDSDTGWAKDDTQEYLANNPLPAEFRWPHRDFRSEPDGGLREVRPSHAQVKGGYGKWLRETPYFPGLFGAIHEVLEAAEDLGDAAWLARELDIRRVVAEKAAAALKTMRGVIEPIVGKEPAKEAEGYRTGGISCALERIGGQDGAAGLREEARG